MYLHLLNKNTKYLIDAQCIHRKDKSKILIYMTFGPPDHQALQGFPEYRIIKYSLGNQTNTWH